MPTARDDSNQAARQNATGTKGNANASQGRTLARHCWCCIIAKKALEKGLRGLTV